MRKSVRECRDDVCVSVRACALEWVFVAWRDVWRASSNRACTRRLTAIDLLGSQNKVEANGKVHEYEVESVIHGSSQISSTNLVKPVLVSE